MFLVRLFQTLGVVLLAAVIFVQQLCNLAAEEEEGYKVGDYHDAVEEVRQFPYKVKL